MLNNVFVMDPMQYHWGILMDIVHHSYVTGLSHCRHLKTVRTHLSGLVNATIVTVDEPCDASKGLTLERWREMNKGDVVLVSWMFAFQFFFVQGVIQNCRPQHMLGRCGHGPALKYLFRRGS